MIGGLLGNKCLGFCILSSTYFAFKLIPIGSSRAFVFVTICDPVAEDGVLKKVLVVDDSLAAVKMMQGILDQGGYPSVGLSDPLRIEETITTEHPGLILLDIVMPNRNGFQICRELKGNSLFGSIPVILVSSRNTSSDKFWGQQQGADAYIAKPFTPEELLETVRRFA